MSRCSWREAYQSQVGGIVALIFELVFISGALFSLYLLIRVYGAEAQRRRLESERENKRNQEAILRLAE